MSEIMATSRDTATKAKPYVCTTCTRPFARLEHLKRHERSHTKEKPFRCEQSNDVPGCGRCFARRDLLLRHQQKIHLFPNTSKRRRLSSVSQASSTKASAKPAQESTDLPQDRFTISIPNFDDLANFENGTVNPSSIYSTSPPVSAHSSSIQHLMDIGLTHLDSQSTNEYSYATEKLLPIGAVPSDAVLHDYIPWSMPDLSIGVASPSSTSSSLYSPSLNFGSLGQTSALQMAGSDSDLFTPDFFTGGGYVENVAPIHHRSKSESMSYATSQSKSQAQLFIAAQLEQITHRRAASFRFSDEQSPGLQFLGGDQAYCNGHKPETSYSTGYVETF